MKLQGFKTIDLSTVDEHPGRPGFAIGDHRISFNAPFAKALGYPKYIELCVSEKLDKFALVARKDKGLGRLFLSNTRKNKDKGVSWSSNGVYKAFELIVKLQPNVRNHFYGEADPSGQALIFNVESEEKQTNGIKRS